MLLVFKETIIFFFFEFLYSLTVIRGSFSRWQDVHILYLLPVLFNNSLFLFNILWYISYNSFPYILYWGKHPSSPYTNINVRTQIKQLRIFKNLYVCSKNQQWKSLSLPLSVIFSFLNWEIFLLLNLFDLTGDTGVPFQSRRHRVDRTTRDP